MKSRKWRWICLSVGVAVILAGFFFPAIIVNNHPPDRIQVQHTAYNLKNAISAYFAEYRAHPHLDKFNEVTIDSDHGLMDVLLGSDSHKVTGGLNPRGIAFFTDKAAKPMSGGRYRKGATIDATGGGELWDPWGNHYRARFDSDGNGRVENPEAPGTLLPETILVWSAGKDGDFNTWKDNVKTW